MVADTLHLTPVSSLHLNGRVLGYDFGTSLSCITQHQTDLYARLTSPILCSYLIHLHNPRNDTLLRFHRNSLRPQVHLLNSSTLPRIDYHPGYKRLLLPYLILLLELKVTSSRNFSHPPSRLGR